MNFRKIAVLLSLTLCSVLLSFQNSKADTITYFGDFVDGFGPVDMYSSAEAYAPGVFKHVFHEKITGLAKFDPSMGTLTGIDIFVLDHDPVTIKYTLGGGMTVTQVTAGMPYGAMASLKADLVLGYTGAAPGPIFINPVDVMGDIFDPTGTALSPLTTPFAASPSPPSGKMFGSKSLFGSVDPADFEGVGTVDTLFLDLFVEDTAMFVTSNATATATLSFDVSAASSSATDSVVGITYTYTAVPEPTSVGLASLALLLVGFRRRRRPAT